jgi:hypothetical protein
MVSWAPTWSGAPSCQGNPRIDFGDAKKYSHNQIDLLRNAFSFFLAYWPSFLISVVLLDAANRTIALVCSSMQRTWLLLVPMEASYIALTTAPASPAEAVDHSKPHQEDQRCNR